MKETDVDDKTRLVINRPSSKDVRTALKKPTPNKTVATEEDRTRIISADIKKKLQASAKSNNNSQDNVVQEGDEGKTRVLPNKVSRDYPSQDRHSPSSVANEDNTDLDLDQEPTVLKKRFVLEQVLGSGGMGVVYKARDILKMEAQDKDPYIAIKVLSNEFKNHPEAIIALQRESRKSQRIAHPNIVNVYDFDKDDNDTVFMTMEYMKGQPLDKLIKQYKATGLPEEDVWNILEGVCAALIYAHAEDIIHSDFKPGNIFVSNKGIAKVFDFGIARAVSKAEHEGDENSIEDKTVFDAGTLGALTPAYASLEMLEGKAPDVRDDIYALGCTAYELFTGQHPYNRVHANEASRQQLKPKRITQLSKRQWRVIEKSLAFKREDRIESVETFWKLLTKRSLSVTKIAAMAVVIIGLSVIGYLQLSNYYFNSDINSFSEDQVRSEIRIELQMDRIGNLLDEAEFTQKWEANLWSEIQSIRNLLTPNDNWLQTVEKKTANLYLIEIDKQLTNKSFERVGILLQNAYRYSNDINKEILMLALKKRELLLADAAKQQQLHDQQVLRDKKIALEKNKQKEKIKNDQKKLNTSFTAALNNVKEQLRCQSQLNMRDLSIAVNKLKSINNALFKKNEGSLVRELVNCITQIGVVFPERAAEQKKAALKIFAKHRQIAEIKISPRDPCDQSLAGLGARGKRAICKDKIAGLGYGPSLVVIPASTSKRLQTFAIGKYEVSIAQMNQFCSQSRVCEKIVAVDPSLPVMNISIDVVRAYLKWLSNKTDRRYRLPSSKEWRYAAVASAESLAPNRNCKLNTRGIQKGDSLVKSSVGGQNPWGLVNHVGNIQEWALAKAGKVVAMGGSYQTEMEHCTLKTQVEHSGKADKITGFRVLRELERR